MTISLYVIYIVSKSSKYWYRWDTILQNSINLKIISSKWSNKHRATKNIY